MERDSDQELVERCRRGDRAAFATLMRTYQRPVYNAALTILRRADDAGDVAQSVFLKVWEKLDDYDPQYKFFSWIYRIAVNEALNVARRNNREEPLDEELGLPEETSSDPALQAVAGESASRVRAALMQMSVNDRSVLILRHFSECSYEEIGATLGLEEKTVKSRLFSARERLAEKMKGWEAT